MAPNENRRPLFPWRGWAPALCSSFAEGELPGVSERGSLRREPGSCRHVAAAAAAAPAFLKLQKGMSEAAI